MDQKSTKPKQPDKTGQPSLLGKRPCLDPDYESDTEQVLTYWPRFLVIKPKDQDKTFSTVSPFAISKALHGIAGELKSVKKLHTGELMVECSKKSHSDNLLKCTTFIDFPVITSPHRSLNSSRGIIRHREFKFCTDEEIQENLSSKGVTDVKRISVTRDGNKTPTNTFILTFNTPTLPSSLKIAWFNVSVEPYIPNPLRCFNCQRFGHHKDKCKCKLVCARCGAEGHEANSCSDEIKCFNCKGKHFAYAKSCPKWISEKEIQTIKYQQNLSYPEARKIVEQRTPSGLSYAAAARPAEQKSFTSSYAQTDFSPMCWKQYKPPQLSEFEMGLSKDLTGSLKSQPGPSRDYTGSSGNHLGSSKNHSHAGSTRNQTTGSNKNQCHSSGSQPTSKVNKSTPQKDNKSSKSDNKKVASTESSNGGGKANSNSFIKKSRKNGGLKPEIPPKPTLINLKSNPFNVLAMDTSEPISAACIPKKTIVTRDPVLAP